MSLHAEDLINTHICRVSSPVSGRGVLRLTSWHKNRLHFCSVSGTCFSSRIISKQLTFNRVDYKDNTKAFLENNTPYPLALAPDYSLEPEYTYSISGRNIRICKSEKKTDCRKLLTLKKGSRRFTISDISISENGKWILVNAGRVGIVYDVYNIKDGVHFAEASIENLSKAAGDRVASMSNSLQIKAHFLGNIIYAEYQPCRESCDFSLIIDPVNNKPIAWAGGSRDFFTYGTRPLRLKGDLWILNEGNLKRIVIQNLKNGKVIKEIPIGKKLSGDISYYDPSTGYPVANRSLAFIEDGIYTIIHDSSARIGKPVLVQINLKKMETGQAIHFCPASNMY